MADGTLQSFSLMRKDPTLILQDVLQKLTVETDGVWDDFSLSDAGTALVATKVALAYNDAMFTDSMGGECFLSTAQDRESVVRLAKSRGYQIGLATPATVSVNLNCPAFNTETLIAANTTWSILGIPFTCLTQIAIPQGQTNALITLTQGTPFDQSYTSSGAAWWAITVPLLLANIQVFVNGTLWTEIDSWIDVDVPTSYLREENPVGQVIRFGNNILTIKPNAGDIVQITGIVTLGDGGNIEQSGIVATLTSVVRDQDGNNLTSDFTALTLTSALGGAPLESTESIRTNAPSDNAAQERAVTLKDYLYWAGKYPGVTSVAGIGGEKINAKSQVFIYIIGTDPYNVSSTLITNVQNDLTARCVGTIQPVVSGPSTIVQMIQETVFGVDNSLVDASTQQSLIQTAITNYINNANIGAAFRQSMQDSLVIATYPTGADPASMYSSTTFTLQSNGNSAAGVVTVGVPSNIDATNAQLLDANGNSLLKNSAGQTVQTQDLTALVSNNQFQTKIAGLADQVVTLKYKSATEDVILLYNQKLDLISLTLTAQLLSP